jgi:restriction endonuclease Mrr
MPIPGFQTITLPMLKIASEGKEYAHRDMRQLFAEEFALTGAEGTALLPSGRQRLKMSTGRTSSDNLGQIGFDGLCMSSGLRSAQCC